MPDKFLTLGELAPPEGHQIPAGYHLHGYKSVVGYWVEGAMGYRVPGSNADTAEESCSRALQAIETERRDRLTRDIPREPGWYVTNY